MGNEACVLAVNRTRAPSRGDLSQTIQRDDFARMSHDGSVAQLVDLLSDFTVVTNLDGVSLASLDRRCHIDSTESGRHDRQQEEEPHSFTSSSRSESPERALKTQRMRASVAAAVRVCL